MIRHLPRPAAPTTGWVGFYSQAGKSLRQFGNEWWCLSNVAVPGGYSIHKWNLATLSWGPSLGGAIKIFGDYDVFIVVDNGMLDVWDRVNSRWVGLEQGINFKDGGADWLGNGRLWGVGGSNVPGGKQVFMWNGSYWNLKPGGLIRIDSRDNYNDQYNFNTWGINNVNSIFTWDGTRWNGRSGKATEIRVRQSFAVMILGTQDLIENNLNCGKKIYTQTLSGWVQHQAASGFNYGGISLDITQNGYASNPDPIIATKAACNYEFLRHQQ